MKYIKRIHSDRDERIRSGFLWLPKSIVNNETQTRETRWLERASWVERFISIYGSDTYWVPVQWDASKGKDITDAG